MKSIFLLIFLPLLGLVFFLLVCKLFDIDINNVIKNPQPTPPPPQCSVDLYTRLQADYENFSYSVYRAIVPLASPCNLSKPHSAEDIYAADISSRVGVNNSWYIFRYEFNRIKNTPLMEGGAKPLPVKQISPTDIARRIEMNLKSMNCEGYHWEKICIYELSSERLRIELCGMGRSFAPTGGIKL